MSQCFLIINTLHENCKVFVCWSHLILLHSHLFLTLTFKSLNQESKVSQGACEVSLGEVDVVSSRR